MARDVIECEWGALRGDRAPFIFGAALAFGGGSILAFLAAAAALGKGGSWPLTSQGAVFAALGAFVLALRGGTTIDRARRTVTWYRVLGPWQLGGGELPFDAFDAVEVEECGGDESETTYRVRLVGARATWLGTWRSGEGSAAAHQAKQLADFMGLGVRDPDGLVKGWVKPPLPTRLSPEEEAALEARRASKRIVVKPRKSDRA